MVQVLLGQAGGDLHLLPVRSMAAGRVGHAVCNQLSSVGNRRSFWHGTVLGREYSPDRHTHGGRLMGDITHKCGLCGYEGGIDLPPKAGPK